MSTADGLSARDDQALVEKLSNPSLSDVGTSGNIMGLTHDRVMRTKSRSVK